METDKDTNLEYTTPPITPPKHENFDAILQQVHRDLVEWMTEGIHPYRIPRADHG